VTLYDIPRLGVEDLNKIKQLSFVTYQGQHTLDVTGYLADTTGVKFTTSMDCTQIQVNSDNTAQLVEDCGATTTEIIANSVSRRHLQSISNEHDLGDCSGPSGVCVYTKDELLELKGHARRLGTDAGSYATLATASVSSNDFFDYITADDLDFYGEGYTNNQVEVSFIWDTTMKALLETSTDDRSSKLYTRNATFDFSTEGELTGCDVYTETLKAEAVMKNPIATLGTFDFAITSMVKGSPPPAEFYTSTWPYYGSIEELTASCLALIQAASVEFYAFDSGEDSDDDLDDGTETKARRLTSHERRQLKAQEHGVEHVFMDGVLHSFGEHQDHSNDAKVIHLREDHETVVAELTMADAMRMALELKAAAGATEEGHRRLASWGSEVTDYNLLWQIAKLGYEEASKHTVGLGSSDWAIWKTCKTANSHARFVYSVEHNTDILTISGTNGITALSDWGHNLDTSTNTNYGIKMHNGFVEHVEQIKTCLDAGLDGLESLQGFDGRAAHAVGHSLGGASATVYMHMLDHGATTNKPRHQTVTYGAPATRHKDDGECSDTVTGRRYSHKYDPVTSDVMGLFKDYRHDVSSSYQTGASCGKGCDSNLEPAAPQSSCHWFAGFSLNLGNHESYGIYDLNV
jgi:hypothetical protein